MITNHNIVNYILNDNFISKKNLYSSEMVSGEAIMIDGNLSAPSISASFLIAKNIKADDVSAKIIVCNNLTCRKVVGRHIIANKINAIDIEAVNIFAKRVTAEHYQVKEFSLVNKITATNYYVFGEPKLINEKIKTKYVRFIPHSQSERDFWVSALRNSKLDQSLVEKLCLEIMNPEKCINDLKKLARKYLSQLNNCGLPQPLVQAINLLAK